MYWRFGTETISAPTFPLHVIGTSIDMTFTLVTEGGEKLNDAYLFTARAEQAGILQAKLSCESTYKNIQGPFDATCYLGQIPADSETSIDIRIDFFEGSDEGYVVIPILLGHDDEARVPNTLFDDDWVELWRDKWDELWGDEW